MAYNDAMTATEWAVGRRAEQELAHDGQTLRELAAAAIPRLPLGSLTLISTSAEGAALAGAICGMRTHPTHWRLVGLGRRHDVAGPVAVVEAVTLSDGMRRALRQRYPACVIVDGPTYDETAQVTAA